jgi:RNA polymerase sigma-70 factor (ECF subfamily)
MEGKAGLLRSLEELALETANGNRGAFTEIYEGLVEPIYGYLYWNLGSREDAEDLTEEVFLRCLVNIDSFNPRRGAFKSWAFRIARNLMVDHQRRGSRRARSEIAEEPEQGLPGPPESMEEKERAKALQEALEELTFMQRQVILMKFFAGMSNAEAASALGRREGAVNALQHRALRRLGKILEDRGWRT